MKTPSLWSKSQNQPSNVGRLHTHSDAVLANWQVNLHGALTAPDHVPLWLQVRRYCVTIRDRCSKFTVLRTSVMLEPRKYARGVDQ